jgi:tetratricopeptide (TPR) repeat protein
VLLLTGCGSRTGDPGSSASRTPDNPLAAAVSAFDEGNVRLAAGRFPEAVDAYQRAEDIGLQSAELDHNAALAFFRMDRLGPAMLHLQRAVRQDPDNRNIRHSLSIVEARRVDSFSELPEPFTVRIHRALMRFMAPAGWFFCGLFLLAGFTAVYVLETAYGFRSDWTRRARLATAVPAAILILYAFTASINPPVDESGVVMADELILRDQPADDGAELVRIHEALVVDIITEAGDWTLIRLPNGATGWIPADGLEQV